MKLISPVVAALLVAAIASSAEAQPVCGDGLCELAEVDSCPLDCYVPDSERAALEAFYASTGGPGWTDATGWLGARGTECSWFGVTCRFDPATASQGGLNVVGLDIWSNNLVGNIPPEIQNLPLLGTLTFPYNNMTGSFQPALQYLSHLWHLTLGPNQFTGEIPAWFGSMTSLELLGLGENPISGTIPPELGNLASLRGLGLGLSQLTGPIPPELCNLTNMEHIEFSRAELTCPIPSCIWALPNLRIMQVWQNFLGSHQPPGVQCPELKENDLEGISQAQNLWVLGLGRNRLHGSLEEIGALTTNLEHLGINGNAFLGRVPDSFLNLSLVDNGSGFDRNGLYLDDNSDPGLRDFLNHKHLASFGGWEETQTIPPSDVKFVRNSPTQATLSWAPIPYQVDPGGYCAYYSTTLGGPYSLPSGEEPELCGPGYSSVVEDKASAGIVVVGLDPLEDYYFVVRSFTEPGGAGGLNPSRVVSEPSLEAEPLGSNRITDQLLGQWHFDEASGSIAEDEVGGNDGLLSGNASFVAGGIFGNAVVMTASGDGFVTMGDIFPMNGTNFTLVVWVKTDAGNQREHSFSMGKHDAGTANGYLLGLNKSGAYGQLGKAWFYVSSFAGQEAISTTTVNDGDWHQVVGVYRQSGQLQLFVDGGASEASNTVLGIVDNSASFMAGGVHWAGAPSGMFDGQLDEMLVFGRALTTQEIQYLFEHPEFWNLVSSFESGDFGDWVTFP